MKTFITIIILLLILGSASWYIAYRLYQGIVSVWSRISFVPVLITVCFFTLIIILGFVRSNLPISSGVRHILGHLSGYCMGIMLYLLLFTIAVDLLMVFPRLFKAPFTELRFFSGVLTAAVLLGTAITCIYGFINASHIHHTSYNIKIESQTNISDINLVMISDLHLGSIGSENRLEEIVKEINSKNPDIVCIAGDFFDTDYNSIQNPQKAINILKNIKSTYGVFASLGNHDGGKTFPQMNDFLKKANITVLFDEYVVIDNRVLLVGRLDGRPIGGYEGHSRKPVDEILPENNELPVVVLDHNPEHIDEYDGKTDLILCGHTHNGQLFPVGLITEAMFTVDYGYYRKDSNSPHVVVSSGVGTWGMPMRTGSHSEIVSIYFS